MTATLFSINSIILGGDNRGPFDLKLDVVPTVIWVRVSEKSFIFLKKIAGHFAVSRCYKENFLHKFTLLSFSPLLLNFQPTTVLRNAKCCPSFLDRIPVQGLPFD